MKGNASYFDVIIHYFYNVLKPELLSAALSQTSEWSPKEDLLNYYV